VVTGVEVGEIGPGLFRVGLFKANEPCVQDMAGGGWGAKLAGSGRAKASSQIL